MNNLLFFDCFNKEFLHIASFKNHKYWSQCIEVKMLACLSAGLVIKMSIAHLTSDVAM